MKKIPPIVYHGSFLKTDKLEANSACDIIKPSKKALYASPYREFALAYAGNSWSDFDINQSQYEGEFILVEIMPGAFKRAYDRDGYLYQLKSDTFRVFNEQEVVSPVDVEPSQVTHIPNVLRELEGCKTLKLYHHPKLPPFIKDHEEYLIERCKKYNANVDSILSFYRKLVKAYADPFQLMGDAICSGKLTQDQTRDIQEIINSMSHKERDYIGNGYFMDHFNIHYIDIERDSYKNPIGFIAVTNRTSGPKAFIIIGVHKKARGAGLGKRMLNQAVQHFKQTKQFKVLEYSVDAGNEASEHLAKSCGFKQISKSEVITKFAIEIK